MQNGTDSLCYDQNCTFPRLLCKGMTQCHIRLIVKSRKTVIKNKYLWMLCNRSCNRKSLLLTTGYIGGNFAEVKRPEQALKLFIRFAIAKGAVTYGLELMMALFKIVQGMISTIMNAAGFGSAQQTVLPQEIVTAVEDCGFFESIPLWAVTLIGGLFITVLSFIMIMSVYGRFFKLYIYTAIAPVPLSAFAGEPSQSVGKSFIKSYAAVCLEGAVIVLACIIFSLFASSPPVVNPDAAAVTMVWSYIGELVFNMLVLVGAVKMADRVVREMIGL